MSRKKKKRRGRSKRSVSKFASKAVLSGSGAHYSPDDSVKSVGGIAVPVGYEHLAWRFVETPYGGVLYAYDDSVGSVQFVGNRSACEFSRALMQDIFYGGASFE